MEKVSLFFLLIVSLIIASCHSDMTQRADKISNPNIIFILADDMGYGDVGVFNKDGV